MKNTRIVIAGGNGFIGEELIKYFGKDNKITILTRRLNESNNRNHFSSLSEEHLKNVTYVQWDGKNTGNWITSLEGADLLINLSGKSVNCRYTKKNKQEIFDSRILPVIALGNAVSQITNPPKLWINASSATIYRHAKDKPQTENLGQIMNDFSVQVCKRWEKTFYDQQTNKTRKVGLRMAITLGNGGVMIPYFNLLKFGLGGRQGKGDQMYSWVHVSDTCRMIEWIYNNDHLEGTFNCSSPGPVTNKRFMELLRKTTNTKCGLPAYEWMLKVGAMVIGTETELVLKSRWVLPEKIQQSGFKFQFPDLEDALTDILKNVPRHQYKLFP